MSENGDHRKSGLPDFLVVTLDGPIGAKLTCSARERVHFGKKLMESHYLCWCFSVHALFHLRREWLHKPKKERCFQQSNGPFGPLMIFTTRTLTKPDLVRICPKPPSTSLTNIARWVPSRFNPSGTLPKRCIFRVGAKESSTELTLC